MIILNCKTKFFLFSNMTIFSSNCLQTPICLDYNLGIEIYDFTFFTAKDILTRRDDPVKLTRYLGQGFHISLYICQKEPSHKYCTFTTQKHQHDRDPFH